MSIRRKEKGFFFEKKKQKTFVDLGLRWFHGRRPSELEFFCFFFCKKRSAYFLSNMDPSA